MKKHSTIFKISNIKKFLAHFFCSIIVTSLYINTTAQGSLSASTKRVLYTIKKIQQVQRSKKIEITPEVKKELNIISRNKVQYIGGLIKIYPATVDMPGLHNLGVVINTKAGDIWSVQIPVETLENISSIKGIEAIDIGGKVKLFLDKARKDTKADEVHQGMNLSKAYLGENVVVGIIDGGFDYTHPTFYDPVTKKNRIVRVWNQNYIEEEAGLGLAPPAGYNYGMELKNLQQIIESIDPSEYNNEAKKFFLSDGSGDIHGTHTAGIATGSGWGTQDKYQGIAPKAEIVMVAFKDIDRELSDIDDIVDAYSNNVIDAIQYIYNYAASVNKPAVINFSAGIYLGPHDGTSLLCQGINNLTGKGKIMVGAAGNDGSTKNHLSHTFTTADNAFTLLGYYRDGQFYTDISSYTIDCWASAGTDFSTKIMVYKDKKKIGETKFIAASLNEVVTDSIHEGTDTAFVKLFTEYLNPNNNRPNILVEITTNKYPAPLSVHLAFKGENTQVHAWSTGFSSTGEPKYITGDDLYTIADGQTAKNIIAVGAYATINKLVDVNAVEFNYEKEIQIGNILSFSSKGPTIDGFTKPDITAPGFIVSSVSSFESWDDNNAGDIYDQISSINGRKYKYMAERGTSMASPVVAGAVALILEANPKLDPQQVLDVLKKTARKDEFTGDIPLTGSNTWGWGKLDILTAVKTAETNAKIFKEPNKIKLALPFIYPNPANNTITIILPKKMDNKNCSYYIFDEFGKQLISNKILHRSLFSISINHLPKGTYLIKITDNNTNTLTNKFIKQ